jgi:molybdopterin-guanine dinucleotide biosynthesis protein A
MGRDKAMLRLAGRTLLGRAVATLRAVPSLKDTEGRVVATILGERAALEGADRAIADRYPGCGPLGGIEAALRDLNEGGEAEWAFFLPVDMPFLPPGLIDAFLREWCGAAERGARVCYAVVEGVPQPLVSMMHKAVLPFTIEALTAGQFKVTPVLQSAGEVLASCSTSGIGYSHSALHTTPVSLIGFSPAVSGWSTPPVEEKLKRLWFSNVNNEEELRDAETFASSPGSS